MATTKETVLARIIIDDDTKVGFQSYARNAERAKKTTEAFRTQAVDKLVESLDKQVLALGKSARQLDIAKAATLGATAAEQALVSKLHDDINAHNQAEAAASRLNKEREQAAAATDRVAAAVHRSEQAYLQERATVGMTADELEIYRLKMMGANQAQLESVMSTQQATKAFRQQGSAAAGTAKGGLRLMRGGMGQLGHQVQDVAVQLQMGQNAMLIFGQQGSQVASLFGKNGALIGAVLAVGAALATYLAPKLFSSKDALEELKKTAGETAKILNVDFVNSTVNLATQFSKLSQESETLANAKIRLALVNSVEAATTALDGMRDAASGLHLSDTMIAAKNISDEFQHMADKLGINREEAKKLRAMYIALATGQEGAGRAITSYVNELQEARDPNKEYNTNLTEIAASLEEYVHELNRAEKTQKLYKEAIDGTITTTKKQSDALEKAKQDKKDLADTVKDHIQALKDENTQLTLGSKALQELQLSRKGYSAEQIKEISRLQEVNRGLLESKALREEDAEAVRAQAIEADNYVNGVVAQADALGKSNIELLLASDLVKGLDTEQKKAFDNAIQRLKEFQAAQEKAQKVESAKGKLESLRQSLLTEEQALEESMVNQNLILVENLALGVINEQTFRDMQLQVIEDFNEKKKGLLDQGVTDELEGMNFLEKATIEGAKRLESFNKLSATEQTQHVLGELSGQFNGIAKNNKRLFAISKAFNIANAIMNTATAATVAYKSYPPPLNYVMAGGVIAAGMGQVAQIKSQSFEGGGFTGNGGRSGGMDGKGGFPAILHPNETVVDHTKGQGGGITVVNNIDATGADANVDMKIRAAMQQTSQQTILSIQDMMRRRRFG